MLGDKNGDIPISQMSFGVDHLHSGVVNYIRRVVREEACHD
jgi:hypothetical protein